MTRLPPLLAVLLFCAGLFCLAQAPSRAAGWLPLGHVGGGGGGSITITAQTPQTSALDANFPVTFSSVAFGAASSGRIVAVGVVSTPNANSTQIGMTIGGVTATCSTGAQQQTGLDAENYEGICYAVVATGTSGTVVVSVSSGSATAANYSVIFPYSIAGSSTPTPVLPASQDPYNYNNDPQTTAAVSIPTGGGAIVAAFSESNVTPSGGNITVDNNIIPTGTQNFVGGHISATGSVTPSTNVGNGDGWGMVVAAWGP